MSVTKISDIEMVVAGYFVHKEIRVTFDNNYHIAVRIPAPASAREVAYCFEYLAKAIADAEKAGEI